MGSPVALYFVACGCFLVGASLLKRVGWLGIPLLVTGTICFVLALWA